MSTALILTSYLLVGDLSMLHLNKQIPGGVSRLVFVVGMIAWPGFLLGHVCSKR